MRKFLCDRCGFRSLVRSNFKFTPEHFSYCRREDLCAENIEKNLQNLRRGLENEKLVVIRR